MTPNPMSQVFQQILHQSDAVSQMRREMIELRLEGVSKDEIYTTLQALRTEVNDTQDDIILEAMDVLIGFCSPHMRID